MPDYGSRLLIVDDNKVNRLLLSRHIDLLGHRFELAENGRIALERLRSEPFDLLLLDIEMPLVSGDEIMHAIREKRLVNDGDEVPVILYSGTEPSELHRLVKETGALGAIHKTRDSAEFTEAFERLVRHL